jgi:GNAT superfamily N-acetyltransferase
LANRSRFTFVVPINNGWQNAQQGLISLPANGQAFTENHCVAAIGYDDNKRLIKFVNSWGMNWGDKGFGYLPYEYFSAYFQDAWLLNPPSIPRHVKEAPKNGGKSFRFGCVDFVHENPLGNTCFKYDLFDLTDSTRIGWCFATLRDEKLDVEEFFIRPEYRGQKHSRILMSRLLSDAKNANVSLRFWIPYCDVYAKTANILALNHILKKHGFTAKKSGVPWALFKAEKEKEAKAPKNIIFSKPPKSSLAPPSGMFGFLLQPSKFKPKKV